jgi:tellurite resistance protein
MNENKPEGSAPALTPAMAVMSVAVLAASADRHWTMKEVERLRLMAHMQPLFRDIASVEGIISSCASGLRVVGSNALMEECRKALTPRLRETAYAWAVEVAHSDGGLAVEEHSFLQELAVKFAIPGPLARKLQAACAIRRRAA